MELSSYAARHRLGDCHAVQATERVEQLVRRAKGRVRLAAEDPLSMSGHRLRRIVAVRSGGRWTDVGSYRRAFNGTPAKLVLVPLLSLAIDEPSAYAMPSDVGENRPRGTLG